MCIYAISSRHTQAHTQVLKWDWYWLLGPFCMANIDVILLECSLLSTYLLIYCREARS